jgi:ABC-type transport system involved in multi-copper enzyme maturation permease subunit
MGEIIRFECRYQLRSPLFWSMAALFFLLAFFAMASEDVSVGGIAANVNFNGSYAIIQTQYVFSLLIMFAGIAFVAGAITRDFESRTAELLFASGVSERSFYFGRFVGGMLFCVLVFVIAMFGTLVGSFMPWLDPERVGPFLPGAYGYSLLVVILPNALLVSCLFYVVAALSRSMLWAYVAALGFLVLYVVLSTIADPEDLKRLAPLDPFGMAPFAEQTRYWTAFERNEKIPQVDGLVLLGRLLWMGIALAALLLGAWRFRFRLGSASAKPGKKAAGLAPDAAPAHLALPQAEPLLRGNALPTLGLGTTWVQLRSQVLMDVRGILRSTPFYVLMAFGLFNTVGGVLGTLEMAYGTPVYPVTRLLLNAIAGSFSLVLLLVLIYYAGELVHRERQYGLKQIVDATPYPSGIMVVAKVLALWFVLFAMLAVVMLTAMIIQLAHGYTNLEPGLYLRGLFGVIAMDFLLLALLSVVIQVLAPNKFLGMMLVLFAFIALQFLSSVGFEHYLYQFGVPGAPYSDMNGYGHYVQPLLSFSAYWLLWGGLLIVLGHLLFVRGVDGRWRERLRAARARLTPATVAVAATLLASVAALGSYIFYNTNVLNDYVTQDEREALDARYEQDWAALRELDSPQLTALDVTVDLFPAKRSLRSRGQATLVNRSGAALPELILTLARPLTVDSMTVAGTALSLVDEDQNVWRYRPAEPVAPDAVLSLQWDLRWDNPGFPNSGATNRLAANGTFVNNAEIMPIPGYDYGRELQDNAVRREHDLPPVARLPALDDERWRNFNFFAVANRADFRAVVSTEADQIAIAPGYLTREWREGERRFFEYEMDKPIWPFVSFTSARYEVVKEDWEGQSLEVYYHRDHHWNVPTMLRSSRDSLRYFSEVFSPYQHRQFRIIEFPSYESFAQSFPNTIPYSEAIGFIADLSDEDDVDFVYYVTAHEAAHQWWGHQFSPARVQGSAVLSETLSQYSALMVMERAYGEPMMRRFLKRELDRYLRGRGGELIEELPLKLAENQPYIHYRKGSLVMYDVKQMLGEDAVNRALRGLIDKFAYQGPPFPRTVDLIAALKAEADVAQQARITDLFEKITIFDLSVADASVAPEGSGFRVTVEVDAAKFYADGEGREQEAPLSETVRIGLFPARPDDLGERDLPPPLLLESRALRSGRQTLSFLVPEAPVWVGVDPYVYRVDRNPEDNLKRIDG